jgi:hypothetical protein
MGGISKTSYSFDNLEVIRTARIRHQCRKTAVLSCHRCLINTGVEKIKMNNIKYRLNFNHEMSLSNSKCRYSNVCLHF